MTTLHTTLIRIAAGLTFAVTALNAHFANAQDLTQMDLTAWNNNWNATQNEVMNRQLSDMIWQNMNNPQVVAMYQQHMAQGLFYGSLEEFAYKIIVTGGMSQEGYARAMGLNGQLDSQFRGQMGDYWGSMDNYRGAYNGYTNGWAENMDRWGNVIMGQ